MTDTEQLLTACSSCAVVITNADTSHLDETGALLVQAEIDQACREFGAVALAHSHTHEDYCSFVCDFCQSEQDGYGEAFVPVVGAPGH